MPGNRTPGNRTSGHRVSPNRVSPNRMFRERTPRHRLPRLLALGLALAALGASATTAEAQRRGNPVSVTQRGLVDRSVTLRVDAGPPDRTLLDSGKLGEGWGLRLIEIDRGRDEDDELALIWGVGVALSFADRVEIGLKAVPLRLDDDRGDDDVRFLDMEAYGRFVFFASRRVEIGGQLLLQFPTWDDFGMGFGVPLLFRLHERVRLDVGAELEIVFDDDVDGDGDDDVVANFDLPFALFINATPRFFFGGRSGVTVYDLDDVEVPVSAFVGYTVGRRHLADFTATFTWFGGDGKTFKQNARHRTGTRQALSQVAQRTL